MELQNFKKYESLTLDLHPQFTLLVGDNGSGKTSILDALAVSLGVWFEVKFEELPDSNLRNSRRTIEDHLDTEGWTEVRLRGIRRGDRLQFERILPSSVTAKGCLIDSNGCSRETTWTRQIRQGARRATLDAEEALKIISRVYGKRQTDVEGDRGRLPVLAYYGSGRAWLPSNKRRTTNKKGKGPSMRWSAFYDCFNGRIRFDDLRDWFARESTVTGGRPGFEAVKKAILKSVPDADSVAFDPDINHIVLSINETPQPFHNLSAGQRMMLAMVADIAIKAVTQNAFLLPPDRLGAEDEPLPRVLRETPGVVLIDELDAHLHPKWQRRVASDLKKTFPAIQFICTSHSPQVIGELKPEEIRNLEGNDAITPSRSFGIDSSRILEELMGAKSRTQEVQAVLDELARKIHDEDFSAAREDLQRLESSVGEDDPEVTRARTLMAFLEE
ncbi:MAG: AAA family ATPase [Candidatus Omnitrophica bacterium]|nr:AAA family ATPase [Candidatus Omnitrophota bacterium]